MDTYMSHPDASAEADLSFGLYSVEFRQDAPSVRCQCGQYLTVTTSTVTVKAVGIVGNN